MSSTTSERIRLDARGVILRRLRARSSRLLLMFAVPLVVVIAGAWWYFSSGRYVSTEDAYVQADTVAISGDVAGRVVAVAVHDNDYVKAGQVLFRLDDRPYRAAVEQAQAQRTPLARTFASLF